MVDQMRDAMRFNPPFLPFLWILIMVPLAYGQGAQRNIRYICEHADIEYSQGLVLVAPGYSFNPGLVQANCTTTVTAQPGLRLSIRVYQKFAIRNCGLDFLRLSDGVSNVSKCGVISTYQPIYTASTDNLHVWYQSGSNTDKIALSVKAFGCDSRQAVRGMFHTLVYENFNQSAMEYRAEVVCSAGHLIEGTLATKASLLCRQDLRDSSYGWVGHPIYRCVAARCSTPSHIANGQMVLDSLDVGAKAIYTCNTGYVLYGTDTQHCVLQSGRGAFWEGINPVCKVVNCGPPLLLNAVITSHIVNTTYNASVDYTCIDGFHLSLDKTDGTAVCAHNGQWQHTPCSVKPVCSQHSFISAGYSVEKVSSSVYQLSCSSTQQQFNITCVANDTWSTQLPQCLGLSAAQQALTSESLTVIGVSVAVTLLIVLAIIIIIIVLLKRKERITKTEIDERKTKTEIDGLSYPSPPTSRPENPGYTRVDVHQADNGQTSFVVEPQRIHAQTHKTGETTARRSDVYSQVRKPRGGGKVGNPVRMVDNDLYGTNQYSVRF